MARFGPLFMVAIGGALGSLIRWGAVSVVDDRAALVVFGCNIVGSLFLGALLGQRERLTGTGFSLLGTGLAGGLTTFSTFAVDVARRLDEGQLLSAFGNGIATPTVAVVAAGLGYRGSRHAGTAMLARTRRKASG